MFVLQAVCLTIVLSVAHANPITFVDCGNKEAKKVDVSSCSASPCVIHKGVDITILVDFVSKEKCNKVGIEILASIGELQLQVPGLDTDACNGHLKCPLAANTNYTLNYAVSIPKLVPEIEADLTARLVCLDDKVVLACGTVHGAIKE